MKTLVCLPTYNERENIAAIVADVLAVAPVDVLVIDDGSPDGTGAIADAIAETEPRVSVLHRAEKRGLGRAYLAGFAWGLDRGYDVLVEMDADFSHQPRHLPELLAAAENHDVVLGSRYVDGGGTENWGLFRRMLSRGGSIYARLLLGLPQRDLTGGFKVFRRTALEALDLGSVMSTGYAFQIELTHRAWRKGFRIAEVPIVFVERIAGRSKMGRGIVAEAIIAVWRMRRQR